jgi:hypothetical protein
MGICSCYVLADERQSQIQNQGVKGMGKPQTTAQVIAQRKVAGALAGHLWLRRFI